MIGSMFLSAAELVELTGRRQRPAQENALRSMGIESKVRPDGRLVVLRRHVEQQLGMTDKGRAEDGFVADWSAA